MLFGMCWLRMQGLISPRAMATYFALTDMHQRRVIGGHRLMNIDLDELERHLGRHDLKRNRMAVGELQRLGLWHETDLGYQPAQSLDHLRIDPMDLRALEVWMEDNGSLGRRRTLLIPRLMFEGFPLLEGSQQALSLELLIRGTWTGDKTETKTITPVSLKVGDIAKRWQINPRTVQDVLHRQGLGANVRLEAVDSSGWRRKKYGCKYDVIISKGAGNPASKLAGLTPVPGRLTVVPKAADPEPEPVHQIAPLEPEPVHQIAPLLNLSINPLLQRDLKTSLNPPAAAQEPEGEQEGTGFLKLESHEGENQLAANSTPVATLTLVSPIARVKDEGSYHEVENREDTEPTADLMPLANTAAMVEAFPSVNIPDDGFSKPNWDRLIEADLSDSARLDPLYEQVIARQILHRTQSTRLNFWTAAVHALRVGKNPPGLFRSVVEKGRWEYLTDEDEQVARAMLRKHHEPPVWKRHLQAAPKPTGQPPDVIRDERPTDVEIVEWVHQVLNQQRYQGDYFQCFKITMDQDRTWTRARWDEACAKSKVRRP
jgi:hypothetical protein